MRRELRAGGFDVIHIHEPVAPVPSWHAVAVGAPVAPLVGTFHTYSENALTHGVAVTWGARRNLNRLRVRIAVSEAAEWTARRFFGGEYRVVPNGVTLPPGGVPAPRRRAPGEPFEIAFVGQVVQRKGLQVLLRAFAALHEHVDARADRDRRRRARARAAARRRARGSGPRPRRRGGEARGDRAC